MRRLCDEPIRLSAGKEGRNTQDNKQTPVHRCTGTTQTDAQAVERALLRLCRGFTYQEQTCEKCKTPVFEEGRKVGDRDVMQTVKLTRRREPNLEAIKLWLSLHPPSGRSSSDGPVYIVDDLAGQAGNVTREGDAGADSQRNAPNHAAPRAGDAENGPADQTDGAHLHDAGGKRG